MPSLHVPPAAFDHVFAVVATAAGPAPTVTRREAVSPLVATPNAYAVPLAALRTSALSARNCKSPAFAAGTVRSVYVPAVVSGVPLATSTSLAVPSFRLTVS